VARGWIGVQIQPVTAESPIALASSPTKGLRRGSPARFAGNRGRNQIGDVISASTANGSTVRATSLRGWRRLAREKGGFDLLARWIGENHFGQAWFPADDKEAAAHPATSQTRTRLAA